MQICLFPCCRVERELQDTHGESESYVRMFHFRERGSDVIQFGGCGGG